MTLGDPLIHTRLVNSVSTPREYTNLHTGLIRIQTHRTLTQANGFGERGYTSDRQLLQNQMRWNSRTGIEVEKTRLA